MCEALCVGASASVCVCVCVCIELIHCSVLCVACVHARVVVCASVPACWSDCLFALLWCVCVGGLGCVRLRCVLI